MIVTGTRWQVVCFSVETYKVSALAEEVQGNVSSTRSLDQVTSKLSTSLQFSSVTQSCPTLCDPLNCSTTGLPVHHQLPEFTQTHVPRVSDAVQPSHPLLALSPPACLQPFPTVARGDVTTEDSGYRDATPLASKMEQGDHQQRKVGASRT